MKEESQPSRDEMHAVFAMCRHNQWNSVLNSIRNNPLIATTSMIMDNHISTTILHQAITSKGDTKARARVIHEILCVAPQAAGIKNGYGSLPLHVLSQRNTKMDAHTKEKLMRELVEAYKPALVIEGGVGKRTPLHIIFTDYISPELTKMMIENGRSACFKKDRKGYLPAHVGASRHCSPEKLSMLLQANPRALTAKTNDGSTLLSLATGTATKSHPNYALIQEIRRYMEEAEQNRGQFHVVPSGPYRVSSDDTMATPATVSPMNSPNNHAHLDERKTSNNDEKKDTTSSRSRRHALRSRKRKASSAFKQEDREEAVVEEPAAADLLLHFSRQNIDERDIKQFATV